MNLKLFNLLDFDKKQIQNWLNKFDTIFTDCDGVLWNDDTAIPGVPETINNLKKCGKQIYFVTNNGTKTRLEIWQRANKLNYDIAIDHIIAPAHSIAEYLKRQNIQQKVYVIGSAAIGEELNAVDIQHNEAGPDTINGKLMDYIDCTVRPLSPAAYDAVVVGFDEHFSYGKMMKAANILGNNKNCIFLATNLDAVHRYPTFSIPGTGAMVTALETCAERKAILMGKPNAMICEDLIAEAKVVPQRTLMIGDSLKVDVPFGINCGFATLLVGSELNNCHSDEPNMPDFTVLHLSDLGKMLFSSDDN